MKGFNFWQFIAGVSLFLYAMNLIEDSVKNLAGRSFKKFLQKQSKSKIKMTAASTVTTAFLQSSSVVLLMVISFVGAGLINLRGALAAVLGANLGTTLDSWVVALIGFKVDFEAFSFPLLGIALLTILFFRPKSKVAYLGNFIIGFAFIFVALSWLKGCVDQSVGDYLMVYSNLHYVFFILIGFVLTAIIQSSSVTIAITLTGLYNHILPFENAAAIVIGSELGTTLKFLLGSFGNDAIKKQVSWGNFLINFLTLAFSAIFLKFLLHIVLDVFKIENPLTALVVFQTGINLIALVVFYPLLDVFANALERIFPNKISASNTKFIGKVKASSPSECLNVSEDEIMNLLSQTIALNMGVFGINKPIENGFVSSFNKFNANSQSYNIDYAALKLLHGEILNYLSELPKEIMSMKDLDKQNIQINVIRHVIRSAKNLKDIRHNLLEFENSANDELFKLLNEINKRAVHFYSPLQLLIDNFESITELKIRDLYAANRKDYEASVSSLLPLLKSDKISEMDSTNLLNVYREVYSSDKALIRTLADLKELEIED